jgi:hypothetical protein
MRRTHFPGKLDSAGNKATIPILASRALYRSVTSMKATTLLLLTAAPVLAGTTPAPAPAITPAPSSYWLTPTIDIRARYEFADIDDFDPSHAFTVRERLGLKTAAWNGFSAFIEGEFTQSVVDDYSAGPSNPATPQVNPAGVDPFVPGNSAILDPDNNELNQLYGQYAGFDTTVKLGRQKIVYDNAAFVGDVGWRQNQQTYDGLSITNKSIPGLTASYAYVGQVNRIFGVDANGVFENAPGEIHLLNASYAGIQGVTLGGYIYLMDFDEAAADKWDNDTFGLSAKTKALGFTFYGELAYQEDAGNLNDEQGLYAHVFAMKEFGKQSLTLGIEHLDAGVQTPLATVHAFNGYADATDTRRIDGNHGGLTDTYLTYVTPIFCGIKWTNAVHFFGDNAISNDLGFGFDSVLMKKFDDHITGIFKLGYFDSSDDQYLSTTRASVELNYAF